MQVTLIALGSGAEETLTAQARAALRGALQKRLLRLRLLKHS